MSRFLPRTLPMVAALVAFACAGGNRPSVYVAPSNLTILAVTDTAYALHRELIFVIHVENNSSEPIVVTGVALRDCENIANPCGDVVRMQVRVPPGQRVNVLTVRRRDRELAWHFRYTFSWEHTAR
jgi:hypothetical protein